MSLPDQSPRAARLPPLTALRAFEAAARHMSFAMAAAELHVTPAALSYQIKNLETHLGTPLFRRLNRAVELTEAGRTLQPGVAAGFAAFHEAQAAVARLSRSGALTVTAGPAITAKWLAPRLFRFAAAHPDIELRFVASLRLMDFDRDGVDAAIRFGVSAAEGIFAADLSGDAVTPLCTPHLAEGLRSAADLAGRTLLHDDSLAQFNDPAGWEDWMEAEGLPRSEGTRGARFSNADHAIDAAVEGGGVVLGRVFLAHRDIAAGRLVAPFARVLPFSGRYRILCPAQTRAQPRMAAFLRWLEAEAAETRAAIAPWLAAAGVPPLMPPGGTLSL